MKSTSRLTLVGAGPGNPDLITLKGVKALKQADVVLYDALTHPDLLQYAPEHAEKIFVGKKCGYHFFKQPDINQLIVDKALSKGHVVRLKGGDPFVFGRGQEEIEFTESFGIPTTMIPGITSSISVPALQGIPLTTRGISESFWVITGTTKTHELSPDIKQAAKSNATVVILMGTRKLKEIIEIYQSNNKGSLPVAIIQNGSLPEEKMVIGTVDTIYKKAEEALIMNPAVIVLGEVVRQHKEFQNFLEELKNDYNKG